MGCLDGFRFLEMAGIGPTQFAGMLLCDMGAEVVRIDRVDGSVAGVDFPERFNLMNRGRRSLAVDLKHERGAETVLRLVERADALFEGFRPGVMERLGLGPESCLERNRRLVYGRMTGWGQEGPMADSVGHDPNYIAIAGVLGSLGPSGEPPTLPLNLIGDFAGGALYLVTGLLAALLEASTSGRGQVVDTAMVDGAASLTTVLHGLKAAGLWAGPRGRNVLDGGAPFYSTYETRDGEYIVVGALEPRFQTALLERLDLPSDRLVRWSRPENWPAGRRELERIFETRTRDEWCELFEGSEACLSPVLSLDGARDHPHNRARESFLEADGITQPAPAPRFSRTPSKMGQPPPERGHDTESVLLDWGFSPDETARLGAERAILLPASAEESP